MEFFQKYLFVWDIRTVSSRNTTHIEDQYTFLVLLNTRYSSLYSFRWPEVILVYWLEKRERDFATFDLKSWLEDTPTRTDLKFSQPTFANETEPNTLKGMVLNFYQQSILLLFFLHKIHRPLGCSSHPGLCIWSPVPATSTSICY